MVDSRHGNDLANQEHSVASVDHAQQPDTAPLRIDRISHPVFVLAYLANLTLVTANAAMFIFADWVAWLATQGASEIAYFEELPGRIAREGLIAAICARLFLGMSIDYFGVRIIWLFMATLTLIGACIFLSMQELSSSVYVGRMCFVVGISGMFTCGTFHIQSCVDENRRTEFIALLGSSGFVGMILGPQIAALLKHLSGGDDAWFFRAVLIVVVVSMMIYIALMQLCLKGTGATVRRKTRPSLIRLTVQYWPGIVVFVAMTMGLIFTIPSLYLVRFNRWADLGGIATFWTTYALCAFTFRLRTAALSRTVGRHKLITFGLVAQGMGIWLMIPSTEWWHLMFSATICGLGHALLFPSIVSLGSGTFPPEYRGSGTNLTLGCFDLGAAISAPLLGRIIDMPRFDGVGFRPMFGIAGSIPILMAIAWHLRHRDIEDVEVTPMADKPSTPTVT